MALFLAQPSNFCDQKADIVSPNRRRKRCCFFVRLKEIKMPYYNKNIFGNPEIQFTTNWLSCWDWNYRENFNLNSLRIELSLKIIFSAFSYKRNKIRFKSNDRNYSVAKTRYYPFWKIIRFPEIARKFPRLLSISQR